MPFVLSPAVADWLVGLGVIADDDLEGPPDTDVPLTRAAAAGFENGSRVAQLLQLLEVGADPSQGLSTIKDVQTPVARLYNWNILLPLLHHRGVEVDADMKVLIVAGDDDIVIDVLNQLHAVEKARNPAPARGQMHPRAAAAPKLTTQYTSVVFRLINPPFLINPPLRLRTFGWGGLGWGLGVDGAGRGLAGCGSKKRGKEEGREAGRACGERAEGVGCAWGG